MKAVVSITIDEEFVVHDIKIIEGEKGLFIASFCHPVSNSVILAIIHISHCSQLLSFFNFSGLPFFIQIWSISFI